MFYYITSQDEKFSSSLSGVQFTCKRTGSRVTLLKYLIFGIGSIGIISVRERFPDKPASDKLTFVDLLCYRFNKYLHNIMRELDKELALSLELQTPRIPETRSMEGWKQIEIQESNQPLVCLNDLEREYPIKTSPQYYLQGIPQAYDKMFLRQEATERLKLASRLLPPGYSLVVFDAHRPIEVQKALFDAFKNKLKQENPSFDEVSVTKLTEMYVSLPSEDPVKPSPHSTGGAIDLSVCDSEGNLIKMGTDFDSFDTASRTDHFRDRDGIFHKNREVLYRAMRLAGFTNYSEEWWHYDFRNQFWGHSTGRSAIYGLIKREEVRVSEGDS